MKKIYLIGIAMMLAYISFAQSTQLKGKVVDASNNMPLSEATIQISATEGTTSDKEGFFYITCRESMEITVSYLGYEPHKEVVKNCEDELTVYLTTSGKNLNTVEVTATSGTNKSVLYQPSSIAKLSTVEIKRSTGLFMDDAINTNIPGVFMERRTVSAGQQFNIRGYGNGARGTNGVNSNFDGQGYKVYLNGIPITDAEGITLMDDIDFGSIGNVEVVKGPAGSLYGQAIAGVVNLKTIKPEPRKVSIGQDVMLGTYGLQRYTTHLQVGTEKASLLVNYGKQLYSGFMPHTKSNKDFVNAIGEFTPNKRQTVGFYFGYSKSYDERNGELTTLQYDTLDYSGNPRYVKNNAHSNVNSFRAGISHTYNFHKTVSNTTSIFGTGVFSDVSSAGGWTDKSAFNYGFRSSFDTKFDLGKKFGLSGVTGVEAQMQNAQTLGYPMVADSFNLTGYNIIGALRSDQYTVTKTLAAFTEWTLAMPFDISLTAGLGYSAMGIELNDRFYSINNNNPSNPNVVRQPSKYKASYNKMFSPHVALNKVFSKEFSVYASFSRGYKAPVSSYFFIPVTGQVVTGLKPELGTQYELGTKGSTWKKRINYQLAVFYATFADKMTTVAVPDETNTATSYVYVTNGGQQNNLGLEALIRVTAYESNKGFVQSLTPFANLAYSYFRYGDFKYQQLSADKKSVVEVDYSKNSVAGVPPVTFNAGLDFYTKPGLYANITYSFRDAIFYTSDNANRTSSYHLLNAKIGFQRVFAKHYGIEAYVGANNITSSHYYQMVFLNQLPDAYLPAPRKVNFFGGVNLKYIF
ncbi:MAG: TonB-dependent receptor [Bacteroidetes bacterium]|nr:TonB-dependent receptor [Bacteroidota bacterium]